MQNSYEQFVDKLNSYIKKFYLYQLIRGVILSILIVLVYFTFISILEYFSFFEPKIKLSIVVFTLIIGLMISVYFILIPFIKLLGIGKRITYHDVSARLSETYPEIKDRLINIVELAEQKDSLYSNALQNASIDQKINELRIFSFTDAIRFKDLKIILGVLVSGLVIFLFLLIKMPDMFQESTVRLIHFQQKFEKPAPFTFYLENDDLEIITGESLQLKLRCEGKNLPEMMFVNFGGNNFLMSKNGDFYNYTIENLNSSISIYFTDKKYASKIYRVTVLNKPFISFFSAEIQPPSYTSLNSEILQNIGDFKVTSGTTIKWKFMTVDTDSLTVLFSDSTRVIGKKTEANTFELQKVIYNNIDYKVLVMNSKIKEDNSLIYKIESISDLFPEIKVVQVRDSLDFKNFIFKGNILDDYGYSKLDFNVSYGGKDSSFKIPFTPFLLNQDFYYSFNFEQLKDFGKSFTYYFSVFDNDYINHFKRSISETFTFSFPDYQDIATKENADLNSIDQLMDKSSKLTSQIQQDLEDLKLKQINSQLTEWEKFQSVKDIMNKKSELENVIQQINQQNKESNNFQNSFSEEKGELLKKQKQIEQLLNEVFSDDLKKLFDEFNELAKQFDSKKFEQLSKEMNSNLDDLAKQLDKNMQLLKKMKVEQKADRILEELKKLSETEKVTLDKIDRNSDLKRINLEETENLSLLKNLEKDYQDALDFNKTLEKPMNLFNFDQEFEGIKNNYSKVIEDSEKGNRRKTSSGIENNIKSIDQLVFAMDQMLNSSKRKENQANIDDLKQILENLILVSFDQESLMNRLGKTDFNNPLVNELKIKQKNVGVQVNFLKDSLYAVSKRAPEISSIITKEMLNLESSVDDSFDNLENGNIGGALMYQQYSITAANNLSLFLSEAIENIKKQDENGQPGDGDCDKPGGKGSKPGMKSLKDSQSSIKEQLQQMIDQMKKGDMGKLSKSIGQTIAQQEIMQQMIRELLDGKSVGSKAGDQLKAIDQLLEQSRKDLINKNINSELINRQNLILSKLLDAEKSEIERDFDEKRESKTAVDIKNRNPESYFEYKNKTKNENELIKPNSFKLRSFYDQKYNDFINQIKN
jgi:hypothetical protein